MKKSILVAVFAVFAFSASAQVIRVGTGIGLGGGKDKVGLNLNLLEIGYAPQPKLEFGGYFGLTASASGDSNSASASGGSRYGAYGRYYLREEGFKPYVGLQAGLLSGGSASTDNNGTVTDADTGTKFQAAPMIGFRVGPLNINVAYQSGLMVNAGFLFGFGNFK